MQEQDLYHHDASATGLMENPPESSHSPSTSRSPGRSYTYSIHHRPDYNQEHVDPPFADPSQYGNFYASDFSRVQLGDVYTTNNFTTTYHPPSRLLENLSFPQINNRVHQIQDASPKTYQWLLDPARNSAEGADSFRTWLQDWRDRRMLWIAGKPGSGKSTLMKLIAEDPKIDAYLTSTASNATIVRLDHFFWTGGIQFQRSIEGLYRNLLVQLLQRFPALHVHVEKALQLSKLSDHRMNWPIRTLQHSLVALMQGPLSRSFLFIVIDGLDECGDSVEDHETVLRELFRLTEQPNVKICTSGRPYNKFRDHFSNCPRIQLEKLTSDDIKEFVTSSFSRCERWRVLRRLDPSGTQLFVSDIIGTAQGVFLWVGLVVRDLLQILEDGGQLQDLHTRLDDIPPDLEGYFTRILETIEPGLRSDASVLLQLALHREGYFDSIMEFNIMDMICLPSIGRGGYPGTLASQKVPEVLHEEQMRWHVDSALRRLSSRCKGLLECVETRLEGRHWNHAYDQAALRIWKQSRPQDATIQQFYSYTHWLVEAIDTAIEPLHRSFRDFLLLPSSQSLLTDYNNGNLCDSRSLLIDARTVQLRAFRDIKSQANRVVGLTSHIMSALAVYGADRSTVRRYSLMQHLIDPSLSQSARRYWYIQRCYEVWDGEKSNSITLAIDFRLSSYVLANLSSVLTEQKEGRPILDHILRPRFSDLYMCRVFKPYPDLKMLCAALENGADPNQVLGTDGSTIWAGFLRSLEDELPPKGGTGNETKSEWSAVIKTLLDNGAALFLPQAWLYGSRPETFFLRRHQGVGNISERAPQTNPVADLLGTSSCSVITYLHRFKDRLDPDFFRSLWDSRSTG